MRVVRVFTQARRRPSEIGRLPGLSLPWTFTIAQFCVGAVGCLAALWMLRSGVHVLLALVVVGATLLLGRSLRRTRVDERSMVTGVAGWLRWRLRRRVWKRLAHRMADAVVDNVVVGRDHSAWMVFAVGSPHYGMLLDTQAALGSLDAVERLVESVTARRWRLVSTLATVDADTVAARMAATSDRESWRVEIEAERKRLSRGMELTERRFWLWVEGDVTAEPAGPVARYAHRVQRMLGLAAPARASWVDREAMARGAEATVARAANAVGLRPATTGEVMELLERIPRGSAFVPPPEPDDDLPHLLPVPKPGGVMIGNGMVDGGSAWRLGEAMWAEPIRGVAVAAMPFDGRVAHTTAVVAQLPNAWRLPGGGELLWRLDKLDAPWEWCVDVSVVPHSVAAAKTRNQARRLTSEYAQFAGDPAGPPPELDLAHELVETQRRALAERQNSDELVISVALATAVRVDGEDVVAAGERLRRRVEGLRGLAASVQVTLGVPSGDQVAARRWWAPQRVLGPVARDYRQYVMADGLAGLGPCLQSQLGDPRGALLGMMDDRGVPVPVLFDPTLGPRAQSVGGHPRSPSMGIAGKLGSGKSVFAKRVLWTALAAGGRVVVVDRSNMDNGTGEYVEFGKAIAGLSPEISVEVINVTDPAAGSIDPMRAIPDRELAAKTAVKLLSYAAGLDPRSKVASAIARMASERHGVPLLSMVREAATGAPEGGGWSRIVDLVEVLAADQIGGALFDPRRPPADLTADLIVLHAPGLSLVETPDTPSEVAATAVVLGLMLVARAVIAPPERYGALLLDEAWSVLDDVRSRSVVVESIRDGRKHNAAVLLATQSPSDFYASAELAELLGYFAVFGVETESAGQAAAKLAGIDPDLATPALMSLPTGVMMWRDVYGRNGLVDVLLPADPRLAAAIDTTPAASERSAAVS